MNHATAYKDVHDVTWSDLANFQRMEARKRGRTAQLAQVRKRYIMFWPLIGGAAFGALGLGGTLIFRHTLGPAYQAQLENKALLEQARADLDNTKVLFQEQPADAGGQ